MKNMAYLAVTASFLAFVLVFAYSATPALAASQEGSTGYTGGGYASPMTGSVKAGEQGGMYGHMKGQMKEHMKGEAKAGGAARGAVTGGDAVVARVDRPGNCLRIRSGPSASDKEIGCAKMGGKLHLTGVFSKDRRWAQLDNNGWVFYRQLKTDVKPPARNMASNRNAYGSWEYPAGAGSYSGGGYQPYSYYNYGSPYYYGRGFYGYPYRFAPHLPAPPAGLPPAPYPF